MPIRAARSVRPAVLLAALAGLAGGAQAQSFSWATNADGDWDIAANWSPNTAFPNADTHDAVLGLSGPYAVRIDRGITVSDLTVSNAQATLTIDGGQLVTVWDQLDHDGTIVLNPLRTVFNSRLVLRSRSTSTALGTGLIRLVALGDAGDASVESPDTTTTISAGLTIAGSGRLAGSFLNQGLILADDTPDPLNSIAGALEIDDTLTQSSAGELRADGGILRFATATVRGGLMTTANDGFFSVDLGTSSLGDATLAGRLDIVSGQTLELADTLTLSAGEIAINRTAQVFNAVLRFTADTAITGTGTVDMDTAGDRLDAQITAAFGVTGTISPGIVVRGAGNLSGTLVNQGLIHANIPGKDLGTEAALDNSAGVLRATGSRLAIIASGSITGGTLESFSGGSIAAVSGTSFISAVTNQGTLAVDAATLALTGGMTNNGTVHINPRAVVFDGVLRVDDSSAIDGTGAILLSTAGSTGDGQLSVSLGGTLTLGAGQTTHGSGRLVGSFVNHGSIAGDDPIAPLELRDAAIVNTGTIRADGDGLLTLFNTGITGGTVASTGNGLVRADSNSTFNILTDVTNTGTLGVGSGALLRLAGTLTNNATLLVNSQANVFDARLLLDDGADILGSGTIELRAISGLNDARIEADNPSPSTIGAGQTLSGTGRLIGNLVLACDLSPGGDGEAGQLDTATGLVAGNAALASTTHTRFDIGGTASTEFDRLTSPNAGLALDGTIEVVEINGYAPTIGDTVRIVSAPSYTGFFDFVGQLSSTPGAVYRLNYSASGVDLVATCVADLTADVLVNFADVSAFVAAFTSQNPAADINNDGNINFSDVQLFISIFNTPCN